MEPSVNWVFTRIKFRPYTKRTEGYTEECGKLYDPISQ